MHDLANYQLSKFPLRPGKHGNTDDISQHLWHTLHMPHHTTTLNSQGESSHRTYAPERHPSSNKWTSYPRLLMPGSHLSNTAVTTPASRCQPPHPPSCNPKASPSHSLPLTARTIRPRQQLTSPSQHPTPSQQTQLSSNKPTPTKTACKQLSPTYPAQPHTCTSFRAPTLPDTISKQRCTASQRQAGALRVGMGL